MKLVKLTKQVELYSLNSRDEHYETRNSDPQYLRVSAGNKVDWYGWGFETGNINNKVYDSLIIHALNDLYEQRKNDLGEERA